MIAKLEKWPENAFNAACQPLPSGACDPVNGDFVRISLADPGFGMACNPTDAEFMQGVPVTGETCQVNPAAYSLGATTLRRRNDVTASLQIIRGAAINTGEVDTDGIDVTLMYPLQTDNLGNFVFSTDFTWVHQWEASKFPEGTPDFDGAGQTNRDPARNVARSMPDKKGNFTINWFGDRHSVMTRLRYVLNYKDDAPVQIRLENSLDSYYSVDLRYNYTMPIGDNQLVLTFGALDLFNSDLNNVFDGNGIDATVSDPRQRRIYGGVTYSM